MASILLLNALAIFLIATCSFVSEFKAELRKFIIQRLKTMIKKKNKTIDYTLKIHKEEKERESIWGPNDAASALADRYDGGLVLDGDFEDVAEYVVLNESPSLA